LWELCSRISSTTACSPRRIVCRCDYIYIRTIEFVGKVVLMPTVLFAFLWTFPHGLHTNTRIGYSVFFSVMALLIFLRELSGCKHGFKEAMRAIRGKLENPATSTLTNMEMYTFNWYRYGIWSNSASHYHKWKRDNTRNLREQEQIDKNDVPVDSSVPVLGLGLGPGVEMGDMGPDVCDYGGGWESLGDRVLRVRKASRTASMTAAAGVAVAVGAITLDPSAHDSDDENGTTNEMHMHRRSVGYELSLTQT